MKNIFKRTVAMLLLTVMVLGVLPTELSSVFAANVTPSEATQNLLTDAEHNYNFQIPLSGDATKPMGWTEFAKRNWGSFELAQRATGNSALKVAITEEGKNSGATGSIATYSLYSEAINVESYVGKNIMLNVDAKIASGTPNLQFFVFFYTNTNKPTAIAGSGVDGSGSFNMTPLISDEWATASSSQLSKNRTFIVPAGAKYARIFLYFNCKNVGEICIDNIVLKSVCADDAHTYDRGNVSNAIYRESACETRYFKRCDKCDYLAYIPQVGIDAGTAVGRYEHTLTAVPHKAATENATGNIAYWTCGNCGKWFADAKANAEIKDHDDVIIAKRYKNLLEDYNYSFEDTAVGADPEGWVPALAGSENYYEVTDKYASKGSKSLKLFIDETSPNAKGIYSPVISIADMKAISVQAEVYGDAEAYIWVYFYDAAMQEIAFPKGISAWFSAMGRDQWDTVFRKYDVPENARYVKLLLYKPKTTEGTVYLDNLVLKEYSQADEPQVGHSFTDSFEGDTMVNGLPWGWSFANNDTAKTENMTYVEVVDYKSSSKPSSAPKAAVDGTHAMKFTQVYGDEKVRGIYSPYIDVSAMSAVTASVLMYGEGILQVFVMFSDENYVCPEGSDWRPWSKEEYIDDWGQLEFNANVPAGAKYARLCLYKSRDIQFNGSTYIDKVELKESATGKNQVQPDVPEYVEYDWEIAEADHPRIYFDTSGLRRLKKSVKSDALNAMGYTSASAYAELLKEADAYLAETSFFHLFAGFYRVDVQLYPKLEDMSVSEQYTVPPSAAFSMPYPYSTRINMELRNRMKTLALAYAISGEQKYADRAIQYALDMSEWEYWECETFTLYLLENYGEYSNQGLGYCVSGVSAVYDMCYDLLTDAQRKKIENAIITKGLDMLYNDSLSRMTRGKDLDESANLFIGACAIINEENKDQLAKYLNRAMQYANWILTWYENGHNEGYSYGCTAIDQMIAALDTCERVTGKAGMLEHPFVTDILPIWIKGFIESNKGEMVGYRDSPYDTYFPITLAKFALQGDTDAGYLLHLTGGSKDIFEKLVYTNLSDTYVWPIDDDSMNVTVMETMGVASLRTGWGKLDKLMVLYCDDYPYAHTHWAGNSIYFAMAGEWLIRDMGYGSITEGAPRTAFDMKYAVNTIYVDNKPQTVKDTGKVSEIFNTELYGQIRGSTPDAYGKIGDEPVLSRFDRDVIMLNHDSTSYYVVLDDLASSKDRIYGWNMFHLGWEKIELDNEEWDYSEKKDGNHFAILKNGKVLHQYFVGEPLTFSGEYYSKMGETYGPMFRANAKEASKTKQFMTVISAEPEYDGIVAYDSSPLLTAHTSKVENDNPDGFSWSSSHKLGQVIARPLSDSGYKATMFRGDSVGDWMSYPFFVEEGGTFLLSVRVLHYYSYGGTWQIYLDDEPIGEPVKPRTLDNRLIDISFGEREITAGKHVIKVVLIGDANPEGEEWGTLISMGEVLLEKENTSLGNGSVEVLESYDTENVIGATIRYGTVLNDVILSNKGTGAISAGNVTTDGKQAAILGVHEGKINEGYSMLNGTSLKYGDTTLVTADTVMDVTVDFRLSRYPVMNIENEEEFVLDEDFNFDKPKTLLTVTTEKDGTLSFHVGTDVPYTVTVNDEPIEATYADGMLTVSVAEGTHNLVIVGVHHCVYDQRSTNILNVKTWADCTNPTEYYVSCLCGRNGTETFIDGEPKGHWISFVEAKEPTETEDGCIAHYACMNCGAVFADQEGTQPLNLEDVVLKKLGKDIDYMLILWISIGVVVLAGAATATLLILKYKFGIVLFKKKEDQADVESEEEVEAEPVPEDASEVEQDQPSEE